MLVAGGGLRSAVLLLRKVMPDCAQALAQAVCEAQLDNKQGSPDSGGCSGHVLHDSPDLPNLDACHPSVQVLPSFA